MVVVKLQFHLTAHLRGQTLPQTLPYD
jgi:hypothetical protein